MGVDWTAVGAVLTGVSALATATAAAYTASMANQTRTAVRQDRELLEAARQQATAAVKQASAMNEQLAASERALTAAYTPVLAPVQMVPSERVPTFDPYKVVYSTSTSGMPGMPKVQLVLSDGRFAERETGDMHGLVFYVPEVGTAKKKTDDLAFALNMRNVGLGPAVLEDATLTFLYSDPATTPDDFPGRATGVIAVGDEVLVTFVTTANGPIARSDQRRFIDLLEGAGGGSRIKAVVRYRSPASGQLCWTEVDYTPNGVPRNSNSTNGLILRTFRVSSPGDVLSSPLATGGVIGHTS